MGYRSDIRIKFETVNGLDVQGFIEDLKYRLGKNQDLIDNIEIQNDSQIAIIRINDVKWYHTFDDVQIVETWFNELGDRASDWIEGYGSDEDPTVCGAQFLRIGEDLEDNEDIYFGELSSPMYIARSFEEGEGIKWSLKDRLTNSREQ